MLPIRSRRRLPRAWPSLLGSAFLLTQALAQPAPSGRRPDPLDPTVAVPVLRYESALSQYRGLVDDKALSWREANDAVARIGGWRVYAREAQQAVPPAPGPTPAPAPKPALEQATAPTPVSNPPKPPAGVPADMAHQPMPAGHDGHQKP
jgi:hypothetical protein